jgi:diguanylate cyclase (GGDEF)-like protein/PAS domain S-box-containing protein
MKNTTLYSAALLLGALLIIATFARPLIPSLMALINDTQAIALGSAGLALMLLSYLGVQRAQVENIKTLHEALRNTEKENRQLVKKHQEETNRLSFALKSGRLAMWEWGVKNNKVHFSDAWQEMIGFNQHDFPQDLHAWQDRIHPEDANEVQKSLLRILSGTSDYYENIHRVRHHDGHYIWVYDRGQVFYDELGNVTRFSAVRLDITEQKKNDQQLKLDQTLLENTQDAVAIANEEGEFIRTNPAFKQAFGLDEGELSHLTLPTLLESMQDEPVKDILAEVNTQGDNWRGELTLTRHNHEIAMANIVDIHKITSADGTFYTMVCTDITQLKRNAQLLDKLAYEDNVTGLANRHQFYKMLPTFIERANRKGSSFTLMFIDLDDFKIVNDTLGHDVGDQLLRKVGETITTHISEAAEFARVGGDEFVILCEEHTDATTLEKIGQKLNQLLAQPFKLGEHTVTIGSSIGMAIYPKHGKTQSQLLKNADTAMYHAKQSGKGTTTIYREELEAKPKLEPLGVNLDDAEVAEDVDLKTNINASTPHSNQAKPSEARA